MTPLFFLLFAAVALIGALGVLLMRSPVSSALSLVLTFVSLGGLYVLLSAPFVAAVQVIVYAGAIMVLFLFVIMLLNLQKDVDEGAHRAARRVFGWLLGAVLAAQLFLLLRRPLGLGPAGHEPPSVLAHVGNTQAVALRLFTDDLLPFEVVSFVLLVAIVGAVVLSLARGRGPGSEEAP